LKRKRSEQKSNGKVMRSDIGDCIRSLSGGFSFNVLHSRAQAIQSSTAAEFQSPVEIIYTLNSFVDDAETFVQGRMDLADLLATHKILLDGLVQLPQSGDRKNQQLLEKNNRKVVKILLGEIVELLRRETFSLAKAEDLQKTIRGMDTSLVDTESRVTSEMDQNVRIRMSTIGSSHKLPVKESGDDSIEEQLENMCIKDNKTVVIFDESGCIPAYELIGLTRLGITFDAIVAVGDAKQLPPYDPRQNFTPKSSPRSFGKVSNSRFRTFTNHTSIPIKSILDVSAGAIKIKLTTQYRVPRDIAAILNARIYGGDYNTPETCRVPDRGFILVDTPIDRQEKYVNRNEIERCLDLVRQLHQSGESSIMLLTPVSATNFMLASFRRSGLFIMCPSLGIIFFVVMRHLTV
jgi:hypothetical protein